jgi:hypothetical protein
METVGILDYLQVCGGIESEQHRQLEGRAEEISKCCVV